LAGEPVDLGGGVWHYQTALWRTNSILAVAGTEALLCDPNWEPAEIRAIRADAAARAGRATHLLLTHADYDHTCGIGFFPEAEVVAGPETAERIASGEAAKSLAEAGGEWGLEWPGELRVDRIVRPGESFAAGAFPVTAIEARGHQSDGLAYLLPEQGLLLPGDYVSATEYPLVAGSLEAYRRTLERLLEALAQHDLRLVVPGHGPVLSPDEARRVAEDDLAYVERLQGAALSARAEGLAPGWGLVSVYGVVPPRPAPDDFEMFSLRTINARAALAEVAG
jgi:glyoxylase-like metal-dependent hydrolase (beta-lactamase superfamily II)